MISARRIFLIGLPMLVAIVVLAIYGFIKQASEAINLEDKAVGVQTWHNSEVPPRGSIYDRNGVVMAVSVRSYRIELNRGELSKLGTYTLTQIAQPMGERLGKFLGRSAADVQQQIMLSSAPTPTRNVLLDQMLSISQTFALTTTLDYTVSWKSGDTTYNFYLPHFIVQSRTWERVYPQNTTAGAVIGMVRYDSPQAVGFAGIEQFYDTQLRSGVGLRESRGLERHIITPTQYASDLQLTIDSGLQRAVEERLRKSLVEYSATSAHAVIMDSHTGAIYTLASVFAKQASFDPNKATKTFSQSGKFDYKISVPTINEANEPGSVIKALTLASTIDHGKLRSQYYDKGSLAVGPVLPITNLDGAAYGTQDAEGMLAHSINTIAAQMALDMGPEDFYKTMDAYQFAKPTGIDLPGEAGGAMLKPGNSSWKPYVMARDAFGQGMTATPLQVAVAMNAIANDGVVMRPYVVEQIKSGDGSMIETQPISIGRAVSEASARKTRDLMISASKAALGSKIAISGYSVAGKTGTVSDWVTVEGEGDNAKNVIHDTNLTSYAGFLPATAPRLTIVVKISEPNPATVRALAGNVAAPVWRDVAERAVRMLEIPPDIEKK